MVIRDNDPGDEDLDELDDRKYDTSKVNVSLTDLNFPQYCAVAQVVGAALMAFHPEVWMDDPTDAQQRLFFMETLLEMADHAMVKLTLDDAHDLKKKFATVTAAIHAQVGMDPKKVFEKLEAAFQKVGIQVGRDERAAPLDS